MPKIDINGAELYYEEHGTGSETIVFGHGLLFNGRMFEDQIKALKDHYRCVTFDFRGQGRSEVTRDGYDMETLYEDAAELIERLDCAPCHFLGFSMGGFIGIRLAIRRPGLVQSLILVDTSADPEPEENLLKYRLLSLIARWIGPWVVAGRVMPIMFSQSFLSDPARAEARKRWRQYLVANHRIGVTRAVRGVITRQGVYEELDRIRVPTLIVVGEEDVATVPERSERMHARIPNSRLVTIPNAGHMTPAEQPEAVDRALEEFLGRLS